MTSPRTRAALALLLSGATTTGLALAGRVVGAPEVSSWRAADAWYQRVGPGAASISTLRVLALVAAAWLLVAASLQLLSLVVPRALPSVTAAAVAPRWMQRFVHGVAGASLAAGLAIVPPSAAGPAGGLQAVAHAGEHAGEHPEGSEPETGTATLRLALPSTTSLPPPASAAEPGPGTAPATGATGGTVGTVTTVSGDSFWSIAERALIDAGDAEPTDATIAGYWRRVIDVNRGSLVVPADPDLIYAGQVFVLPER